MQVPLPLPSRARRAPVTAAALVAAGAVTALAACGGTDPFAPKASLETVGTSFVVYPLSTAPPPQGSAVELRTPQVLRPALAIAVVGSTPTVAPNFDVAFDTASGGRVTLLPPKLVTSGQYVPRTAFQVVTTNFDSLGAAPGGTYQADSAVRVLPGQTVVIQAQTLSCSVALPVYAKLVVDKIDPTTGAISVRARIDPNCGFKSFNPGVPPS